MDFSKINDYINPCSNGFKQSTTDFKGLTTVQKVATVVLSIFVGLLTLGFGGFATFKAMVDTFKVGSVQPKSTTAPQETVPNPNKQKRLTKEAELSNEDLVGKLIGIPTKHNETEKVKPTDEETAVLEELCVRMFKMDDIGFNSLLNLVKDDEEKFASILALISFAKKDRGCSIPVLCEFFDSCNWPSEALKDRILPQLMAEYIYENGGFAWNNWDAGYVQTGAGDHNNLPGFSCNRIYIDSKKIFGRGDFNKESPKPLSPYLAKSIGIAIRRAAQASAHGARNQSKDGDTKNLRVGVEVVFSQASGTRFPASMIAPLLPHLENIPGLVSLDLSDVGVSELGASGSDKKVGMGFKDEDLDAFLLIFRSNPYLQQANINIDGMSSEKAEEFNKAWKDIWSDPSHRTGQPPIEVIEAGREI